MATINLLFKTQFDINDSIHIMIPSVGDVLENEDLYYNLVAALTAMPIDMMVQLDDEGIDFTDISEYDLFLRIFHDLRGMDTSLIFGDLDLSKFELAINEETNGIVLLDKENDIVIDRRVQARIAATLRRIHNIERNTKRPANNDAKEYMLKRARDKMKRRRGRQEFSQLEPLIIAMVNTEQYKYDFDGTKKLTIYQFNESVRQVINKVDYEHRMHGVYSGTINPKELSQDDLTWIVHKK